MKSKGFKFLLVLSLLGLFLFQSTRPHHAQTPPPTCTRSADANGDGRVNLSDFLVWVGNYAKLLTSQNLGEFTCNGKVNSLDFGKLFKQFVRPTPAPSRIPSPTPQSGTCNQATSTYGCYPDCKPPGVPFESQSWWLEKANPKPGDELPRHLHHAACAPQARDATGEAFSVSGKFDVVYVTTTFNNPAELEWVIAGIVDSQKTNDCPGGGNECIIFNPPLVCGRGTCTYYNTLPIDTTLSENGLKESRPKPNTHHTDLDGDPRQFTTLNFQYYIKNGSGSGSNYRSGPVMIGRGWYDKGFAYANATFKNYMSLFNNRTDISVPIVKGTISLQIGHDNGEGTVRKRLLLDPAFHIDHEGTVLYDEPGNGDKTYNLNTTNLTNGRHILMAQTEEEQAAGVHTGIAKVFIDVQN